MRYGIIEQEGVYWVVDNIAEVYLAGPFLSVHSAEWELTKWNDEDLIEAEEKNLRYGKLSPL